MLKWVWIVLVAACAQAPTQESQTRVAVRSDEPSPRALVHVKKSKKPPSHAWSSPGHAMTMAWLMGSSAFTRQQIDDQLDADLKSGYLHAMQRDLIRFYLLPFDEKMLELVPQLEPLAARRGA